MSGNQHQPIDGGDDFATGDAMMLRQWYLEAAPSPAVRQYAIDRLVMARAVVRPGVATGKPRVRKVWTVAAALAACVLAAVALSSRIGRPPSSLPSAALSYARLVAFEVRLPSRNVHHVALAGDFNGWDPRAMPMHRQGSSDVWKIAIALPPGRHVYSFVVDGTEWVIDPLAPRAELDDLGPANVIAVSGAGD